MQAVDLQALGATIVIHGEVDDSSMRRFNPSIAFHEGKLKIAIRSCNFAVERGGKWYFRDGNVYSKTDVLYGDLDPESLRIDNLACLNLDRRSPTRTLVAGLEDVRLFSRRDGMHAIGFESDRLTGVLHNQSARLAEYLIKGDKLIYLRTLDKPDLNIVEKNWAPPSEETPNFEFTYSPTQFWNCGQVIGEKYTGEIHGGTQLIPQGDGTYLSIVHEKKLEPSIGYRRPSRNVYDKYVYYSYLARHDSDGIITKLSKPFRFGTLENIEFAAGMVEHKSDLLISFGIRDCKYAIARVGKNKILSLVA